MVNEWTREDLPADYKLWDDLQGQYPGLRILSSFPMGTLLDVVVERLNAHHPKPGRWAHEEQAAQLVRMCNEADLKRTRAERERDEWKSRAEAAESRTAPAVTEADIDADPAVFVVRESELPTLHPRYVRNFNLADGQTVFRDATDEDIAQAVSDAASDLRYVLAAHRVIEAGADVDPVEAKAEEFYDVAYPDDPDGWTHQADMHRDPFRRLAAHVLGQEGHHVDQ